MCDNVQFSKANALILSKDDPVFLCPMSNLGEMLDGGTCKYSLCNACFDEHSPKCRCPSNEKRPRGCNHNMKALVRSVPAWWCAEEYRNTGEWENRAQGCVHCKREYILK